MSIAPEKLPLPRRDARKKSYHATAAMHFSKTDRNCHGGGSAGMAISVELLSFILYDLNIILICLGYLKNNRPSQVIDLFLKLDDPIDEINLVVFFNACAELRNEKGLKLGKEIYSKFLSEQIKGKEFNEKILYAVLNMFIKCSDIDNAEKFFKQLNKNAISYGCMMTMYNNLNESDKTLSLYEQMKRENIETDEIIWILIINALAELSDLLTCQLIISELPQKFFNNIQIQNALINMWVSETKKLVRNQ